MKGLAYQIVVEGPRVPAWFCDAPDDRGPDVIVELGSDVRAERADPEVQVLSYPGLATVRVSRGSSVSIALEPGIAPGVIDLLLSGPILGVILHQRGALVQHASAVRLGEHAVVFTGGSTWGKSTAAAALYRRGAAAVADDVVPLTTVDDRVTTVPGYPSMKLWPDAAMALGMEPASLPTIGLNAEKRRFDAPRDFAVERVAVARIYILSKGSTTAIEAIEGREAFVELVRHSYLARYLGDPVDQKRRFSQVELVVRKVKIRRLVQGPIEDLGSIHDLVTRDLSTDP